MAEKCPAICDEAVVQRLLGGKYPDLARRLDHYLLQSYVEDNDSVKWCPSVPHCGRAIRVGAGERYCEVECPCGVGFCFNCAADAHSPCPCSMWELWEAKRSGESENVNWILAHTKSCPKCFKPIEKNGGCNLVTCRCGQYLCWLCGGATGYSHDMTSITGHSCNRFVAEEKKKADDAKRQVYRYTHYYDRFKIHGDSYKVERDTLGPAVEARARRLESDHDRILVRDAGWLAEAHRALLRSRQVLSRSYVFAYYMFGDGDDGAADAPGGAGGAVHGAGPVRGPPGTAGAARGAAVQGARGGRAGAAGGGDPAGEAGGHQPRQDRPDALRGDLQVHPGRAAAAARGPHEHRHVPAPRPRQGQGVHGVINTRAPTLARNGFGKAARMYFGFGAAFFYWILCQEEPVESVLFAFFFLR